MFKEWDKAYKGNFQFVKNKFNYGGHGSLINNVNYIKSPWFCMMHQDDFYKPNHISTILDLISSSEQNTVGVSTTMGSLSSSGKIINSKPRVNWFSDNLDQPGQFLQNLRSQAVPFPATAFNLNIFKKTKVPYHSAAFSDTEQTLKMLSYGVFILSREETMYYRENPNSESHVLNDKERFIGAAIALSRVFCSKEFEVLLTKVEKEKRGLFADQLFKAIAYRIPKNDSLTTLQNLALEQMIIKWGYSVNGLAQKLAINYANLNSTQTVEVINNLSNNRIKTIEIKKHLAKNGLKEKFWNYYFNSSLLQDINLNKKVLKMIYKTIFIFKPNHRLKNTWK